MNYKLKISFTLIIVLFVSTVLASDDSCISIDWWMLFIRDNLPVILIIAIWVMAFAQYKLHKQQVRNNQEYLEKVNVHMDKVEKLLNEIRDSQIKNN